ncbi:MAG: HEAT repeat domain-containing protein [Planctomycetota bacterium]|nr:MAG: HEAT repeat domain-containing protein [Planctomycetota bacterium]
MRRFKTPIRIPFAYIGVTALVIAVTVYLGFWMSFHYRLSYALSALADIRLDAKKIILPHEPGGRFRLAAPPESDVLAAYPDQTAELIVRRLAGARQTERWNLLFIMHVLGEEGRLINFRQRELKVALLQMALLAGCGNENRIYRGVVDEIVAGGNGSVGSLCRFARVDYEHFLAALPVLERIGTDAADRGCAAAFERIADYRVQEKIARRLIEIRSPRALPSILAYAAVHPRAFDRLFLRESVPNAADFLLRNLPVRGQKPQIPAEARTDLVLAEVVRHCFDVSLRSFREEPRTRADLAPLIIPYFGEDAVPHVIAILDGEETDELRRSLALRTLANIGGETAVERLGVEISLARRGNGQLNRDDFNRITDCFAREKPLGAFEVLLEGLDDNEPERLGACVRALGVLGDERAVPYLLERIRRLHGRSRNLAGSFATSRAYDYEAALPFAIGVTRAAGAANDLIDLLGDPDGEVRRNAVWAFGEIGTPDYGARRKFLSAAIEKARAHEAGKITDCLPEFAWSLRSVDVFPETLHVGDVSAGKLLRRLAESKDAGVAFVAAAALLKRFEREAQKIDMEILEKKYEMRKNLKADCDLLDESRDKVVKKWREFRGVFVRNWERDKNAWSYIPDPNGARYGGEKPAPATVDREGVRKFLAEGFPALRTLRDPVAVKILVEMGVFADDPGLKSGCIKGLRKLCGPVFGSKRYAFDSGWIKESHEWPVWYNDYGSLLYWNKWKNKFLARSLLPPSE